MVLHIYKTVENADLKFEPSFEASGGNVGPNPGTCNNICFRLEGDGISSNDYATWKNNNIEIYIGIENTYKTLQRMDRGKQNFRGWSRIQSGRFCGHGICLTAVPENT